MNENAICNNCIYFTQMGINEVLYRMVNKPDDKHFELEENEKLVFMCRKLIDFIDPQQIDNCDSKQERGERDE